MTVHKLERHSPATGDVVYFYDDPASLDPSESNPVVVQKATVTDAGKVVELKVWNDTRNEPNDAWMVLGRNPEGVFTAEEVVDALGSEQAELADDDIDTLLADPESSALLARALWRQVVERREQARLARDVQEYADTGRLPDDLY